MIKPAHRFLLPAVLLVVMIFSSVHGRAQDDPVYDELKSTFKKKYLSIGILFQGVADFQLERSFSGNNGFNVSNARVTFSGELDNGFGYLLKTNIIKSPAVVDAKMYYTITPHLSVDVGLFKPPFSREYLTGAGAIDFVNRSQVVSALAGRRQIGVQLRGTGSDKVVSCGVGMFNGNGFDGNNNDNNEFMYVARLAISPRVPGQSEGNSSLEIAANGAFSNDNGATIGSGAIPLFDGQRFVYGGDFRWRSYDFLLSGEAIGARLKQRGGSTHNPFGYHCTAGYMVSGSSQVLLRWESFRADGLAADSHLLVFGYNLWPTSVTELQVNYVIPTSHGNAKNHQILVNAQLEF